MDTLSLPETKTRPLMPIAAAMVLLDRNEDAVLALMETGELSWAWNIARAGARRRAIRIFRDSVLALMTKDMKTMKAVAAKPESEIHNTIFGHSRPQVKGTDLQRMFSCGTNHVVNLIADGLLISRTPIRTGPNGSPRVPRESVIQFLHDRRVV